MRLLMPMLLWRMWVETANYIWHMFEIVGNGGIWETIALFETIKKDNPGFKYAIKTY